MGNDNPLRHLSWLAACRAADKGNVVPLAELLESEQDLPLPARRWIADVLRRHTLSKKRGGQKAPIYWQSEREYRLEVENHRVRTIAKQKNISLDEAIEEFAPRSKLQKSTLENRVKGKRGATRRRAPKKP